MTTPNTPAAGLTDGLPATPPPVAANVTEIPIERLEPDPFQPRTAFNETSIAELAQSIQRHGILQPLLVRPMQGPNSEDRYWIVAGERRYRASQTLGLTVLPCRVQPYEHTTAAVIALVENVHREDLSEIDKAEALLRIKALTDRTWEEVAEVVRLSRDYVKRLAGLLKLEPEVKEQVRTGQISIRTAIALRPLPARQQVQMAERVLREGLTAEQVRQEIQQAARTAPRARRAFAATRAAAKETDERGRAEQLREHTAALRAVDAWLDRPDWTPGSVDAEQREELETLWQTASMLQQHLWHIRTRLEEEG